MLVGISQSVQFIKERNEKRDFLDQSWHYFFQSIKMEVIQIPNRLRDIDQWLENRKIDAILLSGGNNIHTENLLTDIAPERDAVETSLLNWSIKNKKPLVGICRGFQFINIFFGGSITNVNNHAGNKHSILINPRYKDFTNYSLVNSFHNFGIICNGLSRQLQCIAYTDDGLVEAAHHIKLPILGLMWHPERDNALNSILDRDIIMRHFRGKLFF